jgi:hypothetical protein
MRVVVAAMVLIGVCLGQTIRTPEQHEFNTAMMESTFRIVGNNQVTGTGFVIGRPIRIHLALPTCL